jgi:hypothetical protein
VRHPTNRGVRIPSARLTCAGGGEHARQTVTAHAQLLEKARGGGIDVYFAGDSLTRRSGATDCPDLLAHWRQTFASS